MKTLPCLQQQRRSLLFLGCLMALNLPAQEFPGCVSSSNLLGQLGRPVKTKGGKFLSWSERAQLSSTCISAFGERCHFGVQTTFQCPLSWCPVVPPYGDGNVWGPTPTCIYFSWKPSYQGGSGLLHLSLHLPAPLSFVADQLPWGLVFSVCTRTVERCSGSVFWSSQLSPLMLSSASLPSLPPM